MRVLIIKTSSMGDIIHTFPAITDAGKAIPSITFDWVVEENFSEIPSWNPLVKNVIPVAWRRWRKNIRSKQTWMEWRAFKKKLQATHYDLVIDAQGLLKSAFISLFANGRKAGPDWHSARESFASVFYRKQASFDQKQHAILRLRQLFSQVLGYPMPTSVPEYGIDREQFCHQNLADPYLVFLHGTTWETKHWPEAYWVELAQLAASQSMKVKLLWGNEAEKSRAERIANVSEYVEVLPRLNLSDIVKVLAGAKAVVGMDTGLSHLTAALDVPGISLYGPTDPALTGALGKRQIHLSVQFPCSPCLKRECIYPRAEIYPPCFTTVPPLLVWNKLLTTF